MEMPQSTGASQARIGPQLLNGKQRRILETIARPIALLPLPVPRPLQVDETLPVLENLGVATGNAGIAAGTTCLEY